MAYQFKWQPSELYVMTAADLYFWAYRLREVNKELKRG